MPTIVIRALLLLFWISLLPGLGLLQTGFSQTQKTEANSNGSVVIESIEVLGNKRTKRFIILREMLLEEGQKVPSEALMGLIEQSSRNLFNTSLFNDVFIKIANWEEDQITLQVIVTERLYVLPFPIFRLADRNFNVWWDEMGRDFSRTFYGADVYLHNFRGRNEILNILATYGYNQQLAFYYKVPFIGNQRQFGMLFSGSVSRNKEIAFQTLENKLEFHYNNRFMRRIFFGEVQAIRRRRIHEFHYAGINYNHITVSDTLPVLNPDYLNNHDLRQRYFGLYYRFISDHRNIRYYPTNGYYLELEAEKLGVGIHKDVNLFSVYGTASKFFDLGKNFFLAGQFRGKVSLPNFQPYYNQRSLGYLQNLVRGYELYVIDGRFYGVGKVNVKYRFLSFAIQNKIFPRLEKFQRIPFDFYLKTYCDAGYVRDDQFFTGNPLNNTLLLGYGAGIDLVTAYDLVFRVEYSFNKLRERGLYLHFITDF